MDTLFTILVEASALSLVTFAITLIFRTSFTTNFAQGIIGTFSVFIGYDLYSRYFLSVFSSPALAVIVSILSSAVVGFIIGIFIDVLLIRKSKYSNPLSKQMITMGMVLILTGILSIYYSKMQTDSPKLPMLSSAKIGNISVHGILIVVISIVIIGALFLALKYTKWGLGVRSTASNEKVASMMGVNTKVITALSWAIAAAIGSIAAYLYNAYFSTPINFNLMGFMQINGFLSAVLGGFSTFFGPVVGAILLSFIKTLSSAPFGSYYMIFLYGVILLIILIKPIGLFGKKTTKKV